MRGPEMNTALNLNCFLFALSCGNNPLFADIIPPYSAVTVVRIYSLFNFIDCRTLLRQITSAKLLFEHVGLEAEVRGIDGFTSSSDLRCLYIALWMSFPCCINGLTIRLNLFYR